MGLLIGFVFFGVFMLVTLMMIAGSRGDSPQSKQAMAALAATLAPDHPNSEIVDFRKNTPLSDVSWINRWLSKVEIAPTLRNLLSQADLKWTVGGLLIGSVSCFVFSTYLVYLRTGAVGFALLIGLILSFTPFAFVFYKRSQRFSKFEQELPDALDLMVSALRVGQSLNAALGLVGRECSDPIGSEFRICFDEQSYGLELRAAMENMIARIPIQDLRMISTAILIQKESGGNLAEVLDKAAYVIRERFRLKRQIKVHTAQGRLTGWILSLLPIVLGVILYFLNPDLMSVLWTTSIGVKLLYTAAIMMVVGGLIIRRIIRLDA
jgi:tight adherence protein B